MHKMICGNFRESVSKSINLEDVEGKCFSKLIQLGCGKEGLVAGTVQELLDIGELAERLQMEAVRAHVEHLLSKELRVENVVELIQRSEANGLGYLQRQCYKMLVEEFEVISQQREFLMLSEETIADLLEEDEIGTGREEDMFEALVKWMTTGGDGLRGERLVSRIRYGVMRDEYLSGEMLSALPEQDILNKLVGETMTRRGKATADGAWDGVERLCRKWMVTRRMKSKVFGDGVLKDPTYIAIDSQGRNIVCDAELHQVIVFNRDGSIARRLGSRGTAVGQFITPMGVAVDRQGRIVVADSNNNRIQVMDADGSVARCFGTQGIAAGQLNRPRGVAIDSEGHIVVADYGNHRVQVFLENGSLVRQLGSNGDEVGHLIYPTGVAVDREGRIVVADSWNHRVQVFNGDGSAGLCLGCWGAGRGHLKYPRGVAVDREGRIMVADTDNHRVQVFNSDGSVARKIDAAGGCVGQLTYPRGVAVDSGGRILIAEEGRISVADGFTAHRVQDS